MIRAYYNENDHNAAAWLRELMKEGLIPDGEVDERSIADVRADDLRGFGQCHFFAGIGGWPLALGLAGYADLECWTGSCPCQPFSLAGKRGGFDDARHLWPVWKNLIAERRPSIVFGEQVASATAWLRLVRSDLEALEYAVGAMPIEAASAGADHKRDRFWFVANAARVGRREGRPEYEVRSGRNAAPRDGGSFVDDDDGWVYGGAVADADGAGSQGRIVHAERFGERAAGPGGVGAGIVADAVRDRVQDDRQGKVVGPKGSLQRAGEERERVRADARKSGNAIEWAIGADGKARRVEPGIRLLVDGFPSRVGLLRGFGNAIDPRPAAAFIAASVEAMRDAA